MFFLKFEIGWVIVIEDKVRLFQATVCTCSPFTLCCEYRKLCKTGHLPQVWLTVVHACVFVVPYNGRCDNLTTTLLMKPWQPVYVPVVLYYDWVKEVNFQVHMNSQRMWSGGDVHMTFHACMSKCSGGSRILLGRHESLKGGVQVNSFKEIITKRVYTCSMHGRVQWE